MDSIQKFSDFKDFASYYRGTVYDRFVGYMPHTQSEEFNDAIRVYTVRKGNYRRPAYLLLWNMLYGGNIEEAILPAAVQQASEDFILIHDDIEDGNELRRGGPAAHALYGMPKALNAGDAIYTILWRMIADATRKLGDERGKRYFDKIYDILFMTTIGQHLDISLANDIRDITKFTPEDYYRSIHAKSAYYSVYGPMQVGAILANVDQKTVDGIQKYGTPVGLAFQIADDILDCISTEGELGKSIGTDVRSGAKTLILYHAVQNASNVDMLRMKAIYQKAPEQKSREEVQFILGKFAELGSIDYARKEAERLVQESLVNFNTETRQLPDSDLKRLAKSSLEHSINRSK